jgi:methyl-accepting chemotaxis protein
MDDKVLEKKKGLNLMTKILITALIPLILIVVLVGVSIHSVGSVVAKKLVMHEMQTASYALEMTFDSLGSGDYHSDGTNLYKGNYNLNSNNQTIDDFKKKTNVDVTVFWKKTRMVTSAIDKDGKRVTGTAIPDSVYDKVMQDGKYFSDNVDIEGTEYYGYYEALKNADGSSQAIIFTGMPSSDVKAIYKKRLVNTTVFMIIITLMACALLAVVITFIVKAITKVIGHLDEVADGKMDFKISEKLLQRSDEIGNIARSVHTLIGGLASIVVNIHHSTGELAEFKDDFQKKFETINNSISNVNVAVDEIANGATSQADETQKVNSQINDMGDAITKTSQNVDSLTQSTEQMKEHNEQLDTTIQELMAISDRNKESLAAVYNQTNETNQSVMHIGNAVDMITDIAGQTNLLSLNASIEAARAGEYGKGFAVVADQIRQLADQSANTAKEIGEIVAELIENSNTSVETMGVVRQEMTGQYEKLNTTKDIFEQLNEEVNNVVTAIESISTEVESLDRLKGEVLGSAESLAAIAQENAASTEETSASMVELGEIVNDCNTKTKQLVDIADSMEENVHKFHVASIIKG